MRRALWVAPGGLPPDEPLRLALAGLGWEMDPADRIQSDAVVPAIVVVETEAGELAALQSLPPRADVVRTPAGAALIAARLERLAAAFPARPEDEVDASTGLPSRAHFARRLPGWLAHRPAGGAHAIAVLALDPFTGMLEDQGPEAGRRLSASVAAVLRRWATQRDLVAGTGAGEYALALSRTGADVMRYDLDDLLDAVRAQRLAGADGLPVTLSAGLTWLVPGDTDAGAMARASSALQRARASGGDGLAVEEAAGEGRSGQDAELERFLNITQVYSERLGQVVRTLGRRLALGTLRDALQDGLTGIPNRRCFDDRLARAFAQARRDRRPLSLLFLDIDDFAAVNRLHGHACGDALLRRFAEVVAEGLRLIDWPARWGGDEFCVLMPETGAVDAAAVAEELRACVEAAGFTTLDDRALALTCSIGVSTLSPALADGAAMAEQARLAVRCAKAAGKNRVEIAAD